MYKKKILPKILTALVASCFTFASFAPVFAASHMPNHHDNPPGRRPPAARVQRPSGPGNTPPLPVNPGSSVRAPRPNSAPRPNPPPPRVHRPNPSLGPHRPPQGQLHRPYPSHNAHRPPQIRPYGHRPPIRPHRPPVYYHNRYPGSYPHWRRSNVVFYYGWPRSSYWWGCRRGLAFGEYLVLALMMEGIRANRQVTMNDLYEQHINGMSYEELCFKYDLDWYSINSRARSRYSQMHAYALGSGISFWAWNDRIYY